VEERWTLADLPPYEREVYEAIMNALKGQGIHFRVEAGVKSQWRAVDLQLEIPLWPIGPLGDLDDTHSSAWQSRAAEYLEKVRDVLTPLIAERWYEDVADVVTLEKGGDPIWELEESRPQLYVEHTCNCGVCGTFIIPPLEAYIQIRL
jgi:hypothetical protein